MNFKDRITNNLERPRNENIYDFCKEYVSISDLYWNLTDEGILKAIDSSLEQILTDKCQGKVTGMYANKTEAEIINIFHQKRIDLFKSIPQSMAKIIQTRIDDFLKKNLTYASSCNMNIPNGKSHLTVELYYNNYLIAKEVIKRLNLFFGNSLK